MGFFKSIIAEGRCYVKKRGEFAGFDTTLGQKLRKAQRREAARQWAAAILLGSTLPGLLLLPVEGIRLAAQEQQLTEPVLESGTSSWDASQVILVQDGEYIQRLSIQEYLTGVLLAEMGPGFSEEALKAQAVVARTYTLRRAETGGRHERCCVCTDHTCCQAWISPEAYLAAGGTQEGLDKVKQAVADTDSLVLRYEGSLIDATYFSCSGGSTEDAVAVWGSDVPYLQATDSPGEENAPAYSQQLQFTARELMDALGRQLEGDPESWFGTASYTAGGGVDRLTVCGIEYTGKELRSLLGLRSTAFTVSVSGGVITFETRGFGHRVGMSQYGADAMAENGADFETILTHYYQGVTLESYR